MQSASSLGQTKNSSAKCSENKVPFSKTKERSHLGSSVCKIYRDALISAWTRASLCLRSHHLKWA